MVQAVPELVQDTFHFIEVSRAGLFCVGLVKFITIDTCGYGCFRRFSICPLPFVAVIDDRAFSALG